MQTTAGALHLSAGSLQPRCSPPAARAACKPLRSRAGARSATRRYAAPEQCTEAQGKQVDAEWVQEVAAEVMDTKQLGQRGEAYFVAQLVSLALVVFPPPFLRPLLDVAGYAAMLGGLALVVAGQQALGRNLTPFPVPRESGTLVTGGVYELVRHPMYGGLLLAAGGLSLASGDELRLLLTAAAFFVLDRKASVEEAALVERFGDDYTQLQRKTKKLLPYIY